MYFTIISRYQLCRIPHMANYDNRISLGCLSNTKRTVFHVMLYRMCHAPTVTGPLGFGRSDAALIHVVFRPWTNVHGLKNDYPAVGTFSGGFVLTEALLHADTDR